MIPGTFLAGELQHASLWRLRSIQQWHAGLRGTDDSCRGHTAAPQKLWLRGFARAFLQARQILNLSSMAPNKEAVREAHRRLDPALAEGRCTYFAGRLLIANHPDKGGSTYIASKINEALGRCGTLQS